MPQILFGYLFRQILFSCFSIGTVVVGIIWIVQSLRYVELVLKTQASFFIFFKISLFILPDLLGVVLPIAALIAILFVYNRLMLDREIVVMQSIGASRWMIALPAITFGLILTGVLYVINIELAPKMLRKMRDLESGLKNQAPTLLLQEGVFTTFGKSTVYVQQKEQDKLQGIFAYIPDPKGEKSYAIMAEEGQLFEGGNGPQIFMKNGNRQELNEKTKVLSLLYFDRTVIEFDQPSRGNAARVYKPYEMGLRDLLFPSSSLPEETKQKYMIEAHQRLITPLLAIVFVLMATAFLLQSSFSRYGYNMALMRASFMAFLLEGGCFVLLHKGGGTLLWIASTYAVMFSSLIGFLVYLFYAKGKPKKKGQRK